MSAIDYRRGAVWFVRAAAIAVFAGLLSVGAAAARAADLDFAAPPKEGGGGQCSDADKATIIDAYDTASMHVAEILERLKSQQSDDQSKLAAMQEKYFGLTYRKRTNKIISIFEEIKRFADGKDKVKIYCHITQQAKVGASCRENVRSGWLKPRNGETAEGALFFCQAFFVSSPSNSKTKWGSLLHEMSHIAARTVDYESQPTGIFALANRDDGLSAANAETYRLFAEELILTWPSN